MPRLALNEATTTTLLVIQLVSRLLLVGLTSGLLNLASPGIAGLHLSMCGGFTLQRMPIWWLSSKSDACSTTVQQLGLLLPVLIRCHKCQSSCSTPAMNPLNWLRN